jgi:hypothetical protein
VRDVVTDAKKWDDRGLIRARPLLPPSPLSARAEAAAVTLTNETVVMWGGMGPNWRVLNDGALLHLDPLGWETIPAAPLLARAGSGLAAANGKLVVWGGAGHNDGAAYDPERRSWQQLPKAPLRSRINHVLRSVGADLLIWGGDDGSPAPLGPRPYLDGARLDLEHGTWSPLPAFPLRRRAFPSRIWCGNRLVVWGGVEQVDDGAPGRSSRRPATPPPDAPPPAECGDAALYDVATNDWMVLPPPPSSPTPSRAIATREGVLLLGLDGSVVEWEPLSGRMSVGPRIPVTSAALAEPGVVVSFVSDRVLVLVPDAEVLRIWSCARDSWRDEGVIEAPSRSGATIAVTKDHLVVWGGFARGRGFSADGTLVSLEP